MGLFGRKCNYGIMLTFDNFTRMNERPSLLIFIINNPSQGGNPRPQEESRRSAKSRGKSQNQLIAEFSIGDKTIVNIFTKNKIAIFYCTNKKDMPILSVQACKLFT